jgi:hypothetical protein
MASRSSGRAPASATATEFAPIKAPSGSSGGAFYFAPTPMGSETARHPGKDRGAARQAPREACRKRLGAAASYGVFRSAIAPKKTLQIASA